MGTHHPQLAPLHVNKVQKAAVETKIEKFNVQSRDEFIFLSLSTRNALIFMNHSRSQNEWLSLGDNKKNLRPYMSMESIGKDSSCRTH